MMVQDKIDAGEVIGKYVGHMATTQNGTLPHIPGGPPFIRFC